MARICNICKQERSDLIKVGVRSYRCSHCHELELAGLKYCGMCKSVKPTECFTTGHKSSQL